VVQRLGNYVGGTPATEGARFRLLSPINHVTAASPPTLLIQGGSDAFVSAPHAQMLADRLAAVGVPHDVLLVPYAQHAFDFISGGLGEQLAEHAVLRFLSPTGVR
ncbi:MAG TPA: prolyl oligopeptidase family serine peptidase, partial [Polyangia bacterium]|nr:prolyl oligopeptidase family serine peptidase [Polyangia bacterium]